MTFPNETPVLNALALEVLIRIETGSPLDGSDEQYEMWKLLLNEGYIEAHDGQSSWLTEPGKMSLAFHRAMGLMPHQSDLSSPPTSP